MPLRVRTARRPGWRRLGSTCCRPGFGPFVRARARRANPRRDMLHCIPGPQRALYAEPCPHAQGRLFERPCSQTTEARIIIAICQCLAKCPFDTDPDFNSVSLAS